MLLVSSSAFAQNACQKVVKIDQENNIKTPMHTIKYPQNPPPPPPPSQEDRRIVYWIHGLGGNQDALSKAAEASINILQNGNGFQARELESTRPHYGEMSDIFGAASEVREDINTSVLSQNTENVDPNDNFIIGHSQGGMVTMALLYKDFHLDPRPENNRFYGGVVSVCSPLQGAIILNNTATLYEMSGEGCEALIAGPAASVEENFLIRLFNKDGVVEDVVENVCDFIETDFTPILFSGQTVPTTENYDVGSEEIEWFNTTPTPGIDRVAFYGVESHENLIWRTMEYFVKSPNSYDFWEANPDYGALWNNAVANKLKYEDKYLEFTTKMLVLESMGFPCGPLEWILSPIGCGVWDTSYWSFKAKRDAWKKGMDWITNLNSDYLWTIGAKEVSTTTTTECECIDFQNFPSDLVTSPGPCPPNAQYCQEQTTTQVTVINKETDGVVRAESASNQPYLTAPAVRLENTSHMQARNNTAFKDALTDLYDGAHGMFFYTEPR